jgi:sugar phosphate isomerase/epimerase
MKFGFCTGFASAVPWALEKTLATRIADAGYEYIEFPLMSLQKLGDNAFLDLQRFLRLLPAGTYAACNLFPAQVKVIGPDVCTDTIRRYIDTAFIRAEVLGIEKIIFGSGASRMIPQGWPYAEAYGQLVSLLRKIILPAARSHNLTVLVEPLNRSECNFINTIREGRTLVERTDEANFSLMVDLYHMNRNAEPPESLIPLISSIGHVHLSGPDRTLPLLRFDEYTSECLRLLRSGGYNGSMSYESKDSTEENGLKKALALLKETVLNHPEI